MQTVLYLAAITYVIFAIVNVRKRPGFVAAMQLSSYGLAVFYGPFGAFTSILGFLASAQVWLSGPRTTSPAPGELPLFCWAALTVVSALISWELDIALSSAVSLIFLCGSSYAMARTFGARSEFLRDLFLGSALILVVCFPMLVMLQSGFGRLGSDTENPVGLASLVEVPAVGALAMLFFDDRWSAGVKLFIGLIVTVTVVPFSLAIGTRSLVVSMTIVFLMFLGLRAVHGSAIRVVLWIITITAGFAFIAVAFWTELEQTRLGALVGIGAARIFSDFAHHGGADLSADARLLGYRDAYALFFAAPVFGHGLASFQYLADNSGGVYVHNLFLEIAVDTGLVGIFLFSWALVRLGLSALAFTIWRSVTWESALVLGLLADAVIRHQVSLSVEFGKLLFFALGLAAAQWVKVRSDERAPFPMRTYNDRYAPAARLS